MAFPQSILKNIYWSFAFPAYANADKFAEALTDYHEDISEETLDIDLDEEILNAPKVIIQYLIYNSAGEPVEPRISLTADNKTGFSAKELLYKIHKEVRSKLAQQDGHFFEGLAFATDSEPGYKGIPLYFMILGS